MVELFIAGLLSLGPRFWVLRTGPVSRDTEDSPRRPRLNEPDGPFTRIGALTRSVARTPWAGFPPASPLTAFTKEGLSSSPCLPGRASDRTSGLAEKTSFQVHSDKPPSSTDERLSTHPALRVDIAAGGELCLLSKVVSLVYRVISPLSRHELRFTFFTTRRG